MPQDFGRSKILSFDLQVFVCLTISRTITSFHDPEKKEHLKTLCEKEQMPETSISSFPTMFSTLSEKKCTI